jgi:Type II secretion system (T2SS), protein N
MRKILSIPLYTMAALVGICIATIGSLPASVAAGLARQATNGDVEFTNLSGTALHGRGNATIRGLAPGQPPLTIRNVEWTINKWQLLLGEVVCVLQSSGPEMNGRAEVTSGFGHLSARNVRFEMPASLISARIPEARSWTTPGVVEVKIERLAVASSGIAGAGELNWRGAQAPDLGDLGEYRANFKGGGTGPMQIDLKTMRGSLRLAGRGEFTAAKGLRMGVTIDFEGPRRAEVMPFFALIGQPQPDGSVAIEINSQLPGRSAAGVNQS